MNFAFSLNMLTIVFYKIVKSPFFKEADQLKHGGRVVSTMLKKDHMQLWAGETFSLWSLENIYLSIHNDKSSACINISHVFFLIWKWEKYYNNIIFRSSKR